MRYIVIVILSLFLSSCIGGDLCSNTTKQELVSPDGKYTATAFIRDCGATTNYSPQVYLRRSGEPAGETGNVFIGNLSEQIEIHWDSPTDLVIVADCKIIKHISEYEGIRISFRLPVLNK